MYLPTIANRATLRNHLLTKHQWVLDDDRLASPMRFRDTFRNVRCLK